MKTRKLIVIIVLVVVLLVGTALTVNAAKKIRLTGGVNYPYRDGPEDEVGWAWASMNIAVDPDTGEATGFANYRSYNEQNPKDWGGWYGNAICGNLIDYGGNPGLVIVVQLEETDSFEVGQYIKFLAVDGGENASEDLLGLILFPPVDGEPDCSYVEPWYAWYALNGNLMIHE